MRVNASLLVTFLYLPIELFTRLFSQPNIFLHDLDDVFCSPSLHFGQTNYGRSAEMSKLLEIVATLEEKSTTVITGACSEGILSHFGAEAVFVSGIAGCGKTRLVQRVGTIVSGSGWIVVQAKFERSTEHGSQVSRFMHDL